jgi:hypothetical protein
VDVPTAAAASKADEKDVTALAPVSKATTPVSEEVEEEEVEAARKLREQEAAEMAALAQHTLASLQRRVDELQAQNAMLMSRLGSAQEQAAAAARLVEARNEAARIAAAEGAHASNGNGAVTARPPSRGSAAAEWEAEAAELKQRISELQQSKLGLQVRLLARCSRGTGVG